MNSNRCWHIILYEFIGFFYAIDPILGCLNPKLWLTSLKLIIRLH